MPSLSGTWWSKVKTVMILRGETAISRCTHRSISKTPNILKEETGICIGILDLDICFLKVQSNGHASKRCENIFVFMAPMKTSRVN